MIIKFLLELLFPQFCFGCQKEGSYLCQDYKSIIGVLNFHQKYSQKKSGGFVLGGTLSKFSY